MKGAGEYYYPIYHCYKELGLEKIHKGYYTNNIYFKFSEHARGKELFIYVIKDKDSLIKNGLYKCDNIKVYGVVSGNPGWTESYGFLLDGKWKTIIQDILDKSIILYGEYKNKCKAIEEKIEQEKKIELVNKAKEFDKLFQ